MIGRTFQHYRVIDRLGEGGMGVVWRAEDLRLGRHVALKLVGGDLADEPQAIERFEAEARLASSINHPHIVSVYDIGSLDDRRFIAMELVDGDNVEAVLASRRVRTDEAVEWALQVADALAAAHRAGVVHRDVKPANIYISRAGFAKLGDFGIAKLREQAADPAATLAAGATVGTVLGSPHYLSPEQAQGEPLDVRTDIFSFAATLYEILSGRRAFPGASPAEVIASLLREDPPPVSQLRPDVPPALERIAMKGLEKRREYRYQHMDDVVADLRRLKRDLETGKGDAPGAAPGHLRWTRHRAVALGAAFLGGGLTALILLRWVTPDAGDAGIARPAYELARLTSAPGLENAPSWSPDGRSIAYTSNEGGHLGIWIRQVPGERSIRVSMPGVDEAHPAWSPDGNWIAYVGGASAATGWDIYVVAAEGGTPVQLTRDRTTVALSPAWSPDGRWITYSSNRAGPLNVWRVGFDRARRAASRAPERLTIGIGEDIGASFAPGSGRIAYATVHTAPNVWAVDVQTRRLRQLTFETTTEDYPRLSPDGERLLFYSDRTGAEEVWMMHIATRELTRVSRAGGTQNAWSPDGRRVAYGTPSGLQLVDLSTGEARTLGARLAVAYPAFSRDGRRVAFQGWNGQESRLYQVAADGGDPLLVPTPSGEPGNPSWSPDGRTLYFQLDQFGRRNIWSVDLHTGQPRQLTQGDADDAHPDVSIDGRRLLFLRQHREVYVMPADGTGEPELVFGSRDHNRLLEWPAWGPGDATIVFSIAEMTGDVFLLRPVPP